MREIKFRAFLKKEKLMCEVLEWIHNGRIKVSIQDSGGFLIQPEDFELMQYTGLKDKNGKEIYEEDIVKFEMTREKLIDHPVMTAFENETAIYQGAVKWEEYGWRPFIDGEVKKLEVIGNIYENPELLGR
jgi:uncharacterized phage protein (TIGR01671 family)